MTPQELKNSILQRAIQGKLVEQRTEEGTGEEVLAAAITERTPLLKGKIIKPEKNMAISEDEQPFDIPESWVYARLNDLVVKTIKRGKSPVYTPKSNTLVFAQKCNVKSGGINMELALFLDESKLSKYPSDEYMLDGDIVVNSTGHGTLGRIGIFHDTDNPRGLPIVPDSHVTIIRACNAVSTDYLFYYLKYCQPYLERFGEGSTNQTELKPDVLKQLIVGVPPLAEQHRIVAKIEELLPLVDRYEKAWSRLENFNKRFPVDMQKSILQTAIQGKLVEQREDEGTGEELYQQIQAEKQRLIKEKKIKKGKPLSEITEDEVPFDVPESWKWVRLEELAREKPANGFSPKGVSYQTDVRNLTLSATTSGYFKPDAFKYVDVKIEDDSKYWLKHNDLLIQRSNSRELVGTSCIYTGLDNVFIYPDLMMRIQLLDFVDVSYVDFVLKSPLTRSYYSKSASGTSDSMPKINQGIVSNTLIPLPPLAEQKRIVAKLEEMLPLCERLK